MNKSNKSNQGSSTRRMLPGVSPYSTENATYNGFSGFKIILLNNFDRNCTSILPKLDTHIIKCVNSVELLKTRLTHAERAQSDTTSKSQCKWLSEGCVYECVLGGCSSSTLSGHNCSAHCTHTHTLTLMLGSQLVILPFQHACWRPEAQ